MDTASSGEPLRTHLRNSKSRRDPVDAIRGIYWFETIRMRTGLPSAYAMERRFEPEAFKEEGTTRYHRNKWSDYGNGKRIPRAVLINRVEVQLPGSAQLINHVLWDVLRVRLPVLENIDRWINELEPSTQHLIFEISARKAGLGRRRRHVDQRPLEMLGRRPTLDALACLTLLAREAAALGRPEIAFHAVPRMLKILLVHASTAPMARIARPLFDLYRESIFALGISEGTIYSLEDYPFEEALMSLNRFIVRCEEREKVTIDWADALQSKLNLLRGQYGFNALLAFAPTTTAIVCPTGSATVQD